ncbi:MAG: mandelate racemase/muconate lactonizing enzyme family protein [bacterium]|nr:mandelate racemase/muconate lactonizing enzyme family protein [bacterium]
MRIQHITATSVFIPYAPPVGPYRGRTAKGEGTLGASGLIVKIETDSGLVGWGEGSRTFETDPNPVLQNIHAGDIQEIHTRLEQAGISKGPISGIEMALWDLLGKQASLPICRLMGGHNRNEVEFTACFGLNEPAKSAATAREYIDRWGFRSLKTKAGNNAEEDLRIAEAVQKEIGDDASLRPDANAGYTPEEAGPLLQKLSDLGIRYYEDPCSCEYPEALAQFRAETDIKILVNMGLHSDENIRNILQHGAADFLMPDTPVNGGLLKVAEVTKTAQTWGVPCLMHCSHDLGLKTAAITHLAAALPNFSGPSDTCYHGLTDDILTEKLTFENGKIRVPEAPGLGVEVDELKVEKYRT